MDKIISIYTKRTENEDKNVIISKLANEGKIAFETALEVNGECIILSKFTENKYRNTKELKMNGIISTIYRDEKDTFW